MPLYRKDLASLLKSGDDVADNLARQDSQRLQSKLDVEKQKQQQLNDIGSLNAAIGDKDSPLAKYLQHGASIHLGNAGIGTDPTTKYLAGMDDKKGSEATKLGSEATKLNKNYADQLTTLERIQDFIQDPNKYKDKQLATNFARLAEGPGQRLLQSVIQASGTKSAPGNAAEAFNWLSGKTESGLTPDEKKAMLDTVYSHKGLIQQQYGDALSEFKAQAPYKAPRLAQSGGLDPYLNTIGSSNQAVLDRLGKGEQAYRASQQPNPQGDAAALATKITPQSGPANVGSKIMGGLRGLLGVPEPRQAPTPQPQAPNQSTAPVMPKSRSIVKVLQNTATGQKKIQYSDGTEEIQ